MQIVIPMSGFGERFRKAGHAAPKPLIEVDGKPISAMWLTYFPVKRISPSFAILITLQIRITRWKISWLDFALARIIGVSPHKLGQIHTVRQIEHLLAPPLNPL